MQQVSKEFPFEYYHISPGLTCNLACTHCGNSSGPKEKTRLKDIELENIKQELQQYSPPKLQFTGGEPTLFIAEVNNVISAHPDSENVFVMITTNGWYSKSKEKIREILGKFKKLDALQLSFDSFHGSILNLDNIKDLKGYCSEKNIEFNVSMCISDPVQLIQAKGLTESLDIDIIFQKVDASGRAKETGVDFKYPSFEKEVLDKTCPNLSTISYLCGKGHTICCGNLIYNENNVDGVFHNSIEEHKESKLFQEYSNKTFREILKEKGIPVESLRPEHSSPCALCEHIQTCGVAQ